jgi:activating signal cointegrator 1
MIRALTLKPPWGSAMAARRKANETRSWAPRGLPAGSLIVITQSATWDSDLRFDLLLDTPLSYCAELRAAMKSAGIAVENCPLGAALCVVRFQLAARTEHIVRDPERYGLTPEEQAWGDYHPGRWAWVTEFVAELEPFPVSGALSLWEMKPDDEARVREQLPEPYRGTGNPASYSLQQRLF